ncbi:MAG: redox-regulated ATPase YchF, partial [Hyphomicrobiales bacterium]|nr:redox-regulated ATPase YchF [Hyphomicrobiales bacterium]
PVGSTSIEEAVVPVPDERLDWLTELHNPKKTIRSTVDCMDVPGFNFADDSGRAAARRLINKIRTIDMLVLVIKGFGGDANPTQDLSNLLTELLLADLELVTTRIEKLEKQVNKPTKTQARDKAELALQNKLQAANEAEKPISTAIETETELDIIKSLGFLTLKPMFVAMNTDEGAIDEVPDLSDALDSSVPVVGICAKLEHELSQLDPEDKIEFMADLGLTELAAGRFVNQCYSALGLI